MDVRERRKQLLEKAAQHGISSEERDLLDALNTIQEAQRLVEQHPEIVGARQEASRMQADREFELICRVAYNGKRLQNTIANRNAVFAWYDETKDGIVHDAAAWFVKCLDENPALANTVTWESADPAVRQRAAAAQAAADRDTAKQIALDFDLALNEANIRLLIEQAKESGGWEEVKSFLRSNLLDGLVRASQEDLNQRAQAPSQAQTKWLKTGANPQQLREAARVETVERYNEAQREEADRQLALAKSRHEQNQFPPLPKGYSKEYLLKASKEEYRRLFRIYGDYQLSLVLQGRQ